METVTKLWETKIIVQNNKGRYIANYKYKYKRRSGWALYRKYREVGTCTSVQLIGIVLLYRRRLKRIAAAGFEYLLA